MNPRATSPTAVTLSGGWGEGALPRGPAVVHWRAEKPVAVVPHRDGRGGYPTCRTTKGAPMTNQEEWRPVPGLPGYRARPATVRSEVAR